MKPNAILASYDISIFDAILQSGDPTRNAGMLKDLLGDLSKAKIDAQLTGDDTMLLIRSVTPTRRMFVIISTEFKDITIKTTYSDELGQVQRRMKKLTGKRLLRLLSNLVDLHAK